MVFYLIEINGVLYRAPIYYSHGQRMRKIKPRSWSDYNWSTKTLPVIGGSEVRTW